MRITRGTCEREDRETKRGRQEAEPIVLLIRKITSERETDTTRKQRSGQRAHCIALVKGLCLDKRDRHAVVIVIVIVNSKLLKRHSKAKRRAPAYSRALRQIRGVFQRIVRGRLR